MTGYAAGNGYAAGVTGPGSIGAVREIVSVAGRRAGAEGGGMLSLKDLSLNDFDAGEQHGDPACVVLLQRVLLLVLVHVPI